MDSGGTYPEPLEKIFQKVEEESERRAKEDFANEHASTSELFQKVGSAATHKTRSRRRGSISITRFGQLASDYTKGSQGPSTSRHVSTVSSQSALYQSRAINDSTTSFSSGDSAHHDEDAHMEEDNHVTQLHQIAGRQSISKTVEGLLPRRLSRARSANVLAAGDARMVIGVSVEEATRELGEGGEATRASVHAPGGLRNQPSRMTMAGSSPAHSGWVAKAKGLTEKFRRKSKSSGQNLP